MLIYRPGNRDINVPRDNYPDYWLCVLWRRFQRVVRLLPGMDHSWDFKASIEALYYFFSQALLTPQSSCYATCSRALGRETGSIMFKKSLRGASPAQTIPELEAILQNSYRFIAIDVETANSHVGSICQIGLACVVGDAVKDVVTLLIDPQCHFDAMNTQIHGIAAEHVAGKPTFQVFLDIVGDFLGQHPLIQHSTFDGRAILCATEDCDHVPLKLNWHDSVMVARRSWPEFKGNGGHGLAHLKRALRLDFKHHDAGEDARAAAEVVLLAEAKLHKSFPQILALPTGGRVSKPVVQKGRVDTALAGKVAVFTGALAMTRAEAAEVAARVGITTSQSVSKKVNFLVVGDQDISALAPGQSKSAKHRRAEELISEGHDLQIIVETEFLALVTQCQEAPGT